jgi:glycosyltransferase involved in cell wall biosynthesis
VVEAPREVPLVSVGIPTYNRVDRLRRAVASVLAQDHPAIELLISDNASTDGTAAYCRGLTEQHPNVVTFVNEANVGATENFNRVRAASRGSMLMWLGDDDRLDPAYVSACVAELASRPDAALVAGRVVYEGESALAPVGRRVVCDAPSGTARVRSYYRQVKDNGTFYGLARRSVVDGVPPMRNRMGNDWSLLAAYAFRGPILAIDDVAVTRAVGGATRSLRNVAEGAGQSRFEAEMPQLAIAALVLRDIGWTSPVYAELGRLRRLWLGCVCSGIVFGRFVIPSIPKYLRLTCVRVWRRVARRAATVDS